MKFWEKMEGLGLFLSLLFLLTACGSKGNPTPTSSKQGLKIVTSFYPIYALVKEISGDQNQVWMVQSGAGIHDYEPSAKEVAQIYDADVFVYHSQTLESWAGRLDPNLQGSKLQVIEASQGMTLDKVTGLENLSEEEGEGAQSLYDPHSWVDPLKIAEEGRLLAQKLGEIDPNHRSLYEANAKKLEKRCQDLVSNYQPLFEKVKQKTFVTQHTAFSYLAKRFGLKQLGIAGISPEQEPTARQLAEIQQFVKDYQVKTIFVEKHTSSKVADSIARATGARVKVLDPLEADPQNNKDLLENLEENLAVLAKELKE